MLNQSPLHIIRGIAENNFEFNKSNLERLRKKLLADLNLSGAITITIKDKAYTKDEIIKTIDILLNDIDLDVHNFIYSKPQLLNFLEKENFSLAVEKFNLIIVPEFIKERLHLLLSNKLVYHFKRAIAKRDWPTATGSLSFMQFLSDNAKDICFEKAYQSLSTFNNELYEIYVLIKKRKEYVNHGFATSNEQNVIGGEKFEYLSNKNLANFLNCVPENFKSLKHKIISNIINIMYYYSRQDTWDRFLISNISYMLMNIYVYDTQQAENIKYNHKIYSKIKLPHVPNAIATLVLGILSFGICWFASIFFGIFAILNARKGLKTYYLKPLNYKKDSLYFLKTGRILGIIGIVFTIILLIITMR